LIVASWPKREPGLGFPARAFAMLPLRAGAVLPSRAACGYKEGTSRKIRE